MLELDITMCFVMFFTGTVTCLLCCDLHFWAYAGSPNGIHYAWDAKVPGHNWTFNKHNHKSFLADTCEVEFGQKGLFTHPPWPSELASKVGLPHATLQ